MSVNKHKEGKAKESGNQSEHEAAREGRGGGGGGRAMAKKEEKRMGSCEFWILETQTL